MENEFTKRSKKNKTSDQFTHDVNGLGNELAMSVKKVEIDT